jgi:hypothetical protein
MIEYSDVVSIQTTACSHKKDTKLVVASLTLPQESWYISSLDAPSFAVENIFSSGIRQRKAK